MRKFLNLFLTTALFLGWCLPAYALEPPSMYSVKISGEKTVTMEVGDTLTLTAEAVSCGFDCAYYYWGFKKPQEKDIITLDGDTGTMEITDGFRGEDGFVTRSTAKVTAIAPGDILVRVHANMFNDDFPTEEDRFWDSYDPDYGDYVTIHVIEKGSKSFNLVMNTPDGRWRSDAKKEHGYIWKLTMTPQNDANADSLTAVFESGDDTCVKTASNVAEFFDGNGSVEFAVGLLTEKNIDKFTATISDSSEPNSSASASWFGNEWDRS